MIDLLLLAVLVWYTIMGYRQGLVLGALSLAGFIGGAVLAMKALPLVVDRFPGGALRSVIVVLAMLATAWGGQILGSIAGARLRHRMARSGAGAADQVLGGVASLVAASVVLWFIGGAVRELPDPRLARAVSGSRVLTGIDSVMPQWMSDLAGDFRNSVSASAFPRVFSGVARERIDAASPPSATAISAAVKATVRKSVVKIVGEARACDRGQEGSGAVVAPHRVVTNAHVVAAVRTPYVQLAGSTRTYRATVVLFDARTDIAVLAVPDLTAPALPLGKNLAKGDDALVVGYPEDGPYTVVPARVRSVLKAKGEDIYGQAGAVREVYSLYAKVEQGNSGGPLVAANGSLAGVVFAKSLDDANTGYALTLDEVRDEIEAGIAATATVSTGGCAAG